MDDLLDPTLVCQVCHIPAKESAKYYCHYGAICCLSCKAFFRRYTRGENNLHAFECKTQGNCDIRGARTNCKKCRFKKCIEVGMEPNKVLNEEDRKKYTHPKKKSKVVDVNAFFGSTTPIPRLIDIRNGGMSFEEPQPGPSRPRRSSSSSDSMDFTKRPSEDDDLSSMVLEVEKAFIDAHNDIDPDHHSINLLIAGHINLAKWSSDHTVAFNTIMEVNIPVMHLMARKSRNFLSLTENDQRLLLENNARMLQMYTSSRYMSSKSSMDQFLWITGPKESLNLVLPDVQRMRVVSFSLLNQRDDIIHSQNPDTLAQFNKCLEIIEQHFLYPHFLTPCIANFFLFTFSHWNEEDVERLQEVDKVRAMEREARELIQASINDGGTGSEFSITYIDQLTETLNYMRSIKDVARDVKPLADIPESRHSVIEETLLMENICKLFLHEIAQETRPDFGFLERFIIVHGGNNVPPELRQTNILECYGLSTLRWSLLLKKGFCIEMNPHLQNNLVLVAMLGGPKFDSLPSFKDQVKFVSGIEDFGSFDSSVQTTHSQPMYKIKEFTQLINPKELAKFERLSIALARFVNNNDIYFLTSLVMLLKGDDAHFNWYQSLKRLLFKRLNDYCGGVERLQDVQKVYDEFCNDFSDYVMIQRKVTRMVEENAAHMITV